MSTSDAKRGSVTLRDVAAAANVSVSAVSQAINETGSLHEDTRARILSVAKDMGFTPNRYAASLRRKKTMSIGYVSSSDDDPLSQKRWANYYGQQLSALVSSAASRGYTVTVIPHDQPQLVSISQVDALYVPEVEGENPVLDEARRRNLPIVSNEAVLDYTLSITVRSGYDRATTMALDALRDAGARRIGLLTEVSGYPGDDLGELTYRAWCASNGFEPVVAHGDYGRTNVVEKVHELIAAQVDSIFSFYEEGPTIATELERAGLHMPDDVQFITLCLDDCDQNAALGVARVCTHPELAPEFVINALVELVERGAAEHRNLELPVDFGPGSTIRG